MDQSLPVRAAHAGDIDAIVALVNSAYRGESSKAGWTTEAELLGGQRTDPDSLRERLEASDSVILVHEQADGIVACVALEHTEGACYLGMLTIRPTLQAGGLGKRLLEAAERYARERWQVRSIFMTVIVQRAELIAWYERRGYERTGEYRPFPYGDPRFGLPRREDLRFEILRKHFPADSGATREEQ